MSKSPYLYGINAITEAIEHGESIEKLWIDKAVSNAHMNELLHKARKAEIPIQYVPAVFFKKYANKSHQGVVALAAEIGYVEYTEILTRLFEEGKTPLILALDGITDVRNFGALARTALCMGVDLIIIPGRGSAAINEDAIKTSAGALFQIPVSRVPHLGDCLMYLRDSGVAIVACSEKATENMNQVDFKRPVALVLGSEETGISKPVLKMTEEHVKIPMKGSLDSLNVSVAGGMLLYEVARQRDFAFGENEVRHI